MLFRKYLSPAPPGIGLALGSGAARGLAHIGVLKVLTSEAIPVTHLAGSSIGALIGGLYAAGRPLSEIETIALSTDWKRIRSLAIDVSFQQGLLRGNKVVQFLEEHLGETTFAQCHIPFAVVATDRLTGEMVTITEGRLVDAIRASIAIPVVFEPVTLAGRTLTDGGLSAPVPVSAVRQLGAKVVLAVNLDSHYYDETVTPGWLDIINDAINISRHHLAAAQVAHADVVLNLDAGKHWYQFTNAAERIARGEAATRTLIPEITRALRAAQPWWQRLVL